MDAKAAGNTAKRKSLNITVIAQKQEMPLTHSAAVAYKCVYSTVTVLYIYRDNKNH